ncbi:CUAEP/CCAEP-tail radical SAM protein [Solirubrobacter taibaiensis]|nr:CUAEP/CCAEP-tail radical SAM protein [Solirubrobacter taibaiensis]
MRAVLIGTYELGRQPFGLASPAAWLERDGWSVRCLDLAVESLDLAAVAAAQLVAIHLPMHTATRLAVPVARRVRELNADAHLCFYGLYAGMNEPLLRRLGADSIIAGEFEARIAAVARDVSAGKPRGPTQLTVDLGRQAFLVPQRRGLPPLTSYACLQCATDAPRLVGYTEASRGCRHLCRHCPIVPVYGGRFRIVPREVVLEDIAQQVAAGATHVTFGDPDFFNGPGHAIPLVEAVHARFPGLTYDVTIKVEHLLKHRRHLETLRHTGCLFVTSAVESVDDRVLEIFDKQHTRADFIEAAALMRRHGLPLVPTFVIFTPWTTAAGYLDLLALIAELDLVDHVPPIQWTIRLLIPAGSRLLELPEVLALTAPFDEVALSHPWRHPDPAVDRLHAEIQDVVKRALDDKADRRAIFAQVWATAARRCRSDAPPPVLPEPVARAAVPYLNEPWYC